MSRYRFMEDGWYILFSFGCLPWVAVLGLFIIGWARS